MNGPRLDAVFAGLFVVVLAGCSSAGPTPTHTGGNDAAAGVHAPAVTTPAATASAAPAEASGPSVQIGPDVPRVGQRWTVIRRSVHELKMVRQGSGATELETTQRHEEIRNTIVGMRDGKVTLLDMEIVEKLITTRVDDGSPTKKTSPAQGKHYLVDVDPEKHTAVVKNEDGSAIAAAPERKDVAEASGVNTHGKVVYGRIDAIPARAVAVGELFPSVDGDLTINYRVAAIRDGEVELDVLLESKRTDGPKTMKSTMVVRTRDGRTLSSNNAFTYTRVEEKPGHRTYDATSTVNTKITVTWE